MKLADNKQMTVLILLQSLRYIFMLLFRENTLAERRKRVIQESKYLGGDMEHTHLVKGLDYALLEKVIIIYINRVII